MRRASPTFRLTTARGTPSATIKITCARTTSRCGIAIARAISSSTMRSAGPRTISTGGALRLAFTVQVGSYPDPEVQFPAGSGLGVACRTHARSASALRAVVYERALPVRGGARRRWGPAARAAGRARGRESDAPPPGHSGWIDPGAPPGHSASRSRRAEVERLRAWAADAGRPPTPATCRHRPAQNHQIHSAQALHLITNLR